MCDLIKVGIRFFGALPRGKNKVENTISFPFAERFVLSLNYHKSLKINSKPRATTYSGSYGTFRYSVSDTDGGIQLTSQLKVITNCNTVNNSRQLEKLLKRARKKYEGKIVFKI